MKRVLFDHNVPRRLTGYLKRFDTMLAARLGWAELQNGMLLTAAEAGGFDVLLTGDQRIRFQQSMSGRRIGIVSMSDNHWNIVREHVPTIITAIDQCAPGTITNVYCGIFAPRKFRGVEGTS